VEQEDTSGHEIQFAVSLKPDRDEFLRRTCPACGRDFKTQIDPADLQWELDSQCRRMGVELGDSDAGDHTATRLRCPYCGHEDAGAEMHTENTIEYLKRLVHRELVVPQLNKFFSGLEDSFGGGGHSGGFLSISFEFKHSRLMLPPRPIHGPEPADFKIIDFLCCGKRIKVSEEWSDVAVCTYCGTRVVLI
jgi:DNA-directed RNA polymerase subunit RPC12/RpoP